MTHHISSAFFLSASLAAAGARADEGMWTFDAFPSAAVGQKYGFAPSATWLEHVRLASVRLARGCSGSFVSPDGLVLTNHHCAHGCIEQLSTAKRDYVAAGFSAATPAQEFRCPEIEVNRLVAIEDVTPQVTGATRGLSGEAFSDAQKAEMARLEKACATSKELRCDVVMLYRGGRYHLYKYQRFQDVRLVFAPEFAIAFFGGDPDNFNFPRFDLDVAFLRVYEGGKPARLDHYLPVSPRGAKEGDLVFVSGHPGSTNRLSPMVQLAFERDVSGPARLLYQAELRGVVSQLQKKSAESKRISSGLLYSLENGYKAREGRLEALRNDAFMTRLAWAERELRARVDADPELRALAGDAWDAWAQAVRRHAGIYMRYMMLEEGYGFKSNLFDIALQLVRAADELGKPNEKRLREYTDARLPALEQRLFSTAPLYDELETTTLGYALGVLRRRLGADDPLVRKVLGERSPDEAAAALVKGTSLRDPGVRKALYAGGKKAVEASADSFILLARAVDPEARAVRRIYENEVEAPVKQAGEAIARASFRVRGTGTYPDATFTLRLSYGEVKGWTEPDGRVVAPLTTLGGAFARATGHDPFRLPNTWIQAKAKLDLATPFNLASTNDIIGGNSGSPLINRDAELVGVVFDGNIHSLAGDFGFEASNNRTVAVHSAALLEALDKVYSAARLVTELRAAGAAK